MGLAHCFTPFEISALSKGNSASELEWGTSQQRLRGLLTILLSPCPQEALPGLIWDLGQQLGDLSLESGGLEQESGRSSGEHGEREQGLPGTPQSVLLSPISSPPPPLPLGLLSSPLVSPSRPPDRLSPSPWNPGFYEDPSSTGGPDSPPSTFCGPSATHLT